MKKEKRLRFLKENKNVCIDCRKKQCYTESMLVNIVEKMEKKMYKVILFDLDGTLTESGEGITKSIQYALEKMGKPEPDLDKLKVFIGPPAKEQFMRYASFDEEKAELAVKFYRERYAVTGMFENRLYDGVKELLDFLRKKGYVLAVASSKPEIFVKKILEHYELNCYFSEIVGSELDGTRAKKAEVIEEALIRLGFQKKRSQVIMVGDKEHDIIGAKTAGIACVAVSYGYGSMEELKNAKPLRICDSIEELLSFFCMTPLRKHKRIAQWWRVLNPVLLRLLITETAGGLLLSILMLSNENAVEAYYKNAVWITGMVGILAAVPMLFLYRKDKLTRKIGGLADGQQKLSLFEMLVLLFVGASLSQVMNIFLGVFSQWLDYQSYSDSMSAMTDGMGLGMQIFWMGILAPFAEEVAFRWMLYLRLQDYYKRGWAIIVSSLIFGICHWNFLQAVYACILGAIFAYILDWSGNLWSCVLLHIGANIWSLVYPIYGTYLLETDQVGILFLVLLLLLLILILGMRMFMEKGKQRHGRCV